MRICVICPTVFSRQHLHSQLWACFEAQTWADKVIVVVDSGPKPSPFFKSLRDDRLRYVHVKAVDESVVSIGTKRNTCAAAAADAELIAHFDDDDLCARHQLACLVTSFALMIVTPGGIAHYPMVTPG